MSLEKNPLQPLQPIESKESDEITYLVLQEEKQNEKQIEGLNEIGLQEQASNRLKETENIHELSTIMKDVYTLTEDRFGQELMQFIEPGQTLENWQHHGYPHVETDPFSPGTNLDDSMAHYGDMHSTSSDTSVTLTVLNSTSTEDASQTTSFALTQPVTHQSLIDHAYYTYSSLKPDLQEYHITECLTVSNPAQMEQENDMGMDQEKLERMKRRKEKNRECSRQFRLKQKSKEQRLTLGKIEKIKTLDSMKRNVEKFKAMLSKISQKCSGCPKTAMLLNHYAAESDKENINPNLVQNFFK